MRDEHFGISVVEFLVAIALVCDVGRRSDCCGAR